MSKQRILSVDHAGDTVNNLRQAHADLYPHDAFGLPQFALARIVAEVRRARVERETLLEALRPFANYACDPPCDGPCHNCIARAIIAKAEGSD